MLLFRFFLITALTTTLSLFLLEARAPLTLQIPEDSILMEVGERQITSGEFIYHFRKHFPAGSGDDVRGFLGAFTDYQLKLNHALEERVHHNPAFINEVIEYRLQLAAPYLTDTGSGEGLVTGTLVDRLKREWDFREDTAALGMILELADERVYRGTWTAPAGMDTGVPLFCIDSKPATRGQFIEYLSDHFTTERDLPVEDYVRSVYTEFIQYRLVTYENYMLESKYPEFRCALQEYREAMLLLEISRRMIWAPVEKGMGDPDVLEEKWMAGLRAKYRVRMHEEVLGSVLESITLH